MTPLVGSDADQTRQERQHAMIDDDRLDKVIIRDLLVRGVIGLNDWERHVEQDILINLVLYVDTRVAGRTDDPAGILDYKAVTKAVIAHVAEHAPLLVERLAADVARICLACGAERATVRVEKPGAVRFAKSVGVEITRRRADFDGDDGDDLDDLGGGAKGGA